MENEKENYEKNIDRPDSCEISVNAKGQWSGKVKSYAGTLSEAMAMTLSKALELERIIYEKNNK